MLQGNDMIALNSGSGILLQAERDGRLFVISSNYPLALLSVKSNVPY